MRIPYPDRMQLSPPSKLNLLVVLLLSRDDDVLKPGTLSHWVLTRPERIYTLVMSHFPLLCLAFADLDFAQAEGVCNSKSNLRLALGISARELFALYIGLLADGFNQYSVLGI